MVGESRSWRVAPLLQFCEHPHNLLIMLRAPRAIAPAAPVMSPCYAASAGLTKVRSASSRVVRNPVGPADSPRPRQLRIVIGSCPALPTDPARRPQRQDENLKGAAEAISRYSTS